MLEGGDLPQLAAEIATLFDVAVLICTADGRVQATAGSQDALRELPLFDPSGRFMTERVVAGSQRAPTGHPGRLVVARIAAGDTDHGRIVAYAAHRDPGPVAVQALERAATVAALAITKKLAVAAVESKFRGDFLRDALAGAAGTARAGRRPLRRAGLGRPPPARRRRRATGRRRADARRLVGTYAASTG